MFWLQILLPVSVALFGALLLAIDTDRKMRSFSEFPTSISNSTKNNLGGKYFKFRSQTIERLEASQDKNNTRDRLSEVDPDSSHAYGEFRYNQFAIATLIGAITFIALTLNSINIFYVAVMSISSGSLAYFLYDRHLTKMVLHKRFQIEAEFPAIIEMLTLAIAAGETPIGAFVRISERSNSKLAIEFSKVVQEVRMGKPFHEALDSMSRNLRSNSIRRFIDALVLAMVRGAPIVEVLYRHVAEARINQRNLVMDKAGKAETSMMIPVVFLILPISVLFALWPSINQLSLFAN